MDLNLPKHRIETIWRTNLQGNYMRGRWEQFTRNTELRPYLLYDAINDSRTRPSHLAHDGVIRPVHDPFWKAGHTPPLGYNCRCSLISLSEAQARARSGFNANGEGLGLNKVPTNEDGRPAQPDPGWAYHPFADGLNAWKPELSRFQPKFRDAAEQVMKGADGLADEMTVMTTVAKALANQPTWKTLGRTDLRTVQDNVLEAAPPLLAHADSQEEAVQILRTALGLQGEASIMVSTPVETVTINAASLPHVVAKRSDQRERFSRFVVPALRRPSEVWQVRYDDGSVRNRYLKLFTGSRYDLLVMVKVMPDGSLFWNMMHRDRKGINSLRIGMLVFDGL